MPIMIKKAWSPHKYLVAAARKTWRWAPERREVLKRVKVGVDQWKCELCGHVSQKVKYITKKGKKRSKTDGAVDHIVPIGKQPREWDDYPDYYKRMFCSVENMQYLCSACHKIKSGKEAGTRAKRKKGKL